MPRKKPTEEQQPAILSTFNRDMVAALIKYMGKRSLTVEVKTKAVTLSTEIAGRTVIFAAMRSPNNLKADVRLYGYLPRDNGLSKTVRKSVVDERQNGWFLKGMTDPDEAAQILFLHLKDVEDRVKDYVKTHGIKAGQKPRRTWSAHGIPFSFFQ